jgi:hypothetical protein
MVRALELTVVVRLSNLGEWEMYRVTHDETDKVLCSVGLCPRDNSVDFAMFSGSAKDAVVASTLRFREETWSDESRERALTQILEAHSDAAPNLFTEHLVFDLAKGSASREPDSAEAHESGDDESHEHAR